MLKKTRDFLIAHKNLIFVLSAALLLRIFGLFHGFPFIFHPDEPTVVRSALEVRFYPNPGHFDWPHLYIYLNFFLYMLFAKLRIIAQVFNIQSILPFLWDDNLVFYFLTRLFSALLGAGTVIPVYLTAKRLFSDKTAIYSSLLFALIPFHVKYSQYTLIDVPMVFFLSWGLFFSSLIIDSNKLKDYLLAGLFYGLAASTKYNGGLAIVTVPLALLMHKAVSKTKLRDLRSLLKLSASALPAIIGFLIGTPFALLDFETFVRTDSAKGALWQFTNVGKLEFFDRLKSLIFNFLFRLPDDFGYTIWLLFVLVCGLATFYLVKKRFTPEFYKLVFLLIPALFFIYYISGFEKSRSHYFMIIYPFVAILAGFASQEIFKNIRNFSLMPKILIILVLFSFPFAGSLLTTINFYRTDTRVVLFNTFKNQFNQSVTVVYEDSDFMPVLKKTNAKIISKDDVVSYKQLAKEGAVYIISTKETSVELISGDASFQNSILIDNNLRNGPKIYVYEL